MVLILCHLFIGLVLGLILFGWFKDERIIIASAFGSILPDLVDKPLGHLLLRGTLDNGRLFFHGLLIVAVILLIGVILRRRRGYHIIFLGVGLGMLFHQLLDTMWNDPVTWFFPFLGPFVPSHYPDYFAMGFWAEITSPTEWIFFIISASMILVVFNERYRMFSPGIWHTLETLSGYVLRCGPWILSIAGVATLAMAFVTPSPSIDDLEAKVMLGVTCMVGAAFLFRWGPRIRPTRSENLSEGNKE